jgi:GNAT superfamily N-acetyltransferase
LGALPLAYLARRRFHSDAAAAVVALAFVLHPALQGIGLAAVHANAFAVPLTIAAFLSLDAGRPRAFVLWCLAALCCREDVALVTFPLGLYAAWRPGFRKAGLGTALMSLAWLGVLKGLLPHRCFLLNHTQSQWQRAYQDWRI